MKDKLYIFDLDGTLAVPLSGNTFRSQGESYVWLPERAVMLDHFAGIGHVAIATNQGGIAAGHLTWDDTEQAIYNLLSQLRFYVPFLFGPYSWTEDKENGYEVYQQWRKPSPVMYLMLARLYPHVQQKNILVIGDREEDRTAARLAGFAFEWSGTFFEQWKEGLR